MKGKVDLNDVRFDWELTSVQQPGHYKLRVHFDQWSIEREYSKVLSRRRAEQEAARLIPELLTTPRVAMNGSAT